MARVAMTQPVHLRVEPGATREGELLDIQLICDTLGQGGFGPALPTTTITIDLREARRLRADLDKLLGPEVGHGG